MATKLLTNKDDTFDGSNKDDVIYGLEGNDSIYGSNGDDEIHGGKGDDILRAGSGNDTLIGGTGDDVLTMYTGHEVLDGGGGIDFIDFFWASRGVRIDLDESSTQYRIGAKACQVDYTSVEAVYGSARSDRVIGNDVDNLLRGEDGDDKVSGGRGDDFLSGGNGRDALIGGIGKDSFLFGFAPDGTKNVDRVEDFDIKEDRLGLNVTVFNFDTDGKVSHFRDIDFRTIDADQFQSGADHDAKNVDIRVIYDSTNGILYYDSNGSDMGGLDQVASLGKHLNLTADSVFGYGL